MLSDTGALVSTPSQPHRDFDYWQVRLCNNPNSSMALLQKPSPLPAHPPRPEFYSEGSRVDDGVGFRSTIVAVLRLIKVAPFNVEG